jgi:Cu(I)/Ag(I) efflux system membrane fusion protein
MTIPHMHRNNNTESQHTGATHVKPLANKPRQFPFTPALLLTLILAAPPAVLFLSGCGSAETHQETAKEARQLYTCGMHPQVIQDKPGNCPICGMKLVPVKQQASGSATLSANDPPPDTAKSVDKKSRKILYWRAPMDPTYIRSRPGKSPMGMDLVPVYEGDEPR